MEHLLDEPEAAKALRISRHTLRAWRKQRRIGFVRLAGRAIRFSESEIARIVREGFQAARGSRERRKLSQTIREKGGSKGESDR